MKSHDPDSADRQMSPRGVAVAALVGTTIEFYDFFVYGTSVVLVLGTLFFPSGNPLTSTLLAFATLGVGFLARPLGGLFFAHFGDRVGRKNTLIVSLMMMGVATVAVGLLPTYDQIGMWAPALLVMLRLVQGLAVGGEWGGAVLLAVEHAPPDKRALYGSFPQFGSPLGLLLSSAVIGLFGLMPAESYAAWGWRMPFLLSVILLAVGVVIRLKMEESTSFVAAQANNEIVSLPIKEIFRTFWRTVVVASGVTLIAHSLTLLVSFLPSYATTTYDLAPGIATTSLVVASAGAVLALVVMARLVDGRDRRRFTLVGGVLTAVWAFPAFYLPAEWGAAGLMISVTVGYVFLIPHYAALSSFLADMFPAHVRYSGVSLCYQLSAVLGGGLLPILTGYLVSRVGGASWPAAALLAGTGLITAASSLLARRVPTTGVAPVVAGPKSLRPAGR
ncbi:MFS transporter [Mycolicibacterium sp.]|uniref:MFS transporter n=1 Tax=Mycolicibacterium sp. TaxID=2320850 RepID=UPI003D0B4826